MIEKIAERKRDEGGDIQRPEGGDLMPAGQGLIKPEGGDLSHEGEPRISAMPEGQGPIHSRESMMNERRPRGVWGMHKQIFVCVGIIAGVCLVVAGLGRDGMLALAGTLLVGTVVSYFAHRRTDVDELGVTRRREGAKNKNFRWDDVDP